MYDEVIFVEDSVRLKGRTFPKEPTSVTVSLKAPDGTVLLTDQAMAYDSTTDFWYYDWIPSSGGHGPGRYVYTVTATNGSYSNKSQHSFEMEELE